MYMKIDREQEDPEELHEGALELAGPPRDAVE